MSKKLTISSDLFFEPNFKAQEFVRKSFERNGWDGEMVIITWVGSNQEENE